MVKPQNLAEFLAAYDDTGSLADPAARRRVLQADPVPAWVSDQPHRAPPQGPFMPLPRLSELPARLAMLEQVRRERAGQISDYRPPRLVYGPGAITGEQDAARVRFSDVAERVPDPFVEPLRPSLPIALAARREAPRAEPPTGRAGLAPPSATYQTSESYRRQRGTPMYSAHYRARMLPNGSAIRLNEPRFDPIPEPPQSAREPVEQGGVDLDAAWNAAQARVARVRARDRGQPKQLMSTREMAQKEQDRQRMTSQVAPMVDPATGWPIDPVTGQPVAPLRYQAQQETEQQRADRERIERDRQTRWDVSRRGARVRIPF